MRNVNVTEVPADAQLIDVREPDEFATTHAAGAVNIPLGELATRYAEIDLDRDIYLICKAGARSLQACEYLEQGLGWDGETILNVEGGTMEWVVSGLPTE